MNFWYLLLAIAVAILLIWIINGNSFSLSSNPVAVAGFLRKAGDAVVTPKPSTCATGKCNATRAVTTPTITPQEAPTPSLKKKASSRRSW